MSENKLISFGAQISKLLNGQNLTREETREMFNQILLNTQPDLQQGAFLAAITAKRPTPEEIAGSWEAIYELDTVKVKPDITQPLVDNCGTGMDSLKTFNISTAAAIVAAAKGVYIAKHGSRAITSKCGAIDILESIGIEVECDIETVKKSIENVGIGIFNGMSVKVHPCALHRILSKIRFGTILNISASLANPAYPQYGVRGVYSKEMIKPTIETMKEIGYKRAIVFHGLNKDRTKGMDEISSIGETFISELFQNGEVISYSIFPEDIGIRCENECLFYPSQNIEQEAINFLKILSGKDRGPKFEIVCLNVAPIFYIVGLADNIKEGLDIAKETIINGQAIKKLKEWVREQNSIPEVGEIKLNSIINRIKGGSCS